jgi:hypothetical protein
MWRSHVTNTGAVVAFVSPIWLPTLQSVSETAALILPIIGVAWLAMQISIKLYTIYINRDNQKGN